jgi:HEAT repeat protein
MSRPEVERHIKALKESDERVRWYAAWASGKIGDARAHPLFRRA